MGKTIAPLDGSTVPLSTLLRAVAESTDEVSSMPDLETLAPSEGRVAVITTDDSVFVGSGDEWLDTDTMTIAGADGSSDGSNGTSETNSLASVSEDGVEVVAQTLDINFAESGAATVGVTDDGDDTATVEVSATDTDNDTQLTPAEVLGIVAGVDGEAALAAAAQAGETLTYDGDQLSWSDPARDDTGSKSAVTARASGTATLSGGEASVDTGVAVDTSSHWDVWPSPVDCDISESIDSTGGTYVIHFKEHTTSVGNPDVGWQLVQSNLQVSSG